MTWKDKLEIGLTDDAAYRRDNLPEFQKDPNGTAIQPGDVTRSPEEPGAREDAGTALPIPPPKVVLRLISKVTKPSETPVVLHNRRHSDRRLTDRRGRGPVVFLALMSLLTAALWADGRTVVKPGWNMFSTAQDIEVGQQVSPDAERELLMLNNSRVDNYINNLGRRLAAQAPGERYPYRFRVVNDRAINAFALPGGPVYINRGVIEAADSESQLAGVIAHEISHVALRHGTNQASKAAAAEMPLAILGGMLGTNSTKTVLAQLGAGFVVNSILLKYSRSAETQADVLGTQILHDSSYDSHAMAEFFETIEAEAKGGSPPEFFSNHPSPENRSERVGQEVTALGGVPRNARISTREFDDIKRYVGSLRAPPARTRLPVADSNTAPDLPSARVVGVENSLLSLSRPENWQVQQQGDAMTIAPRGGLVDDGQGNQALVYGVIVNMYEPRSDAGRRIGLLGPGAGQGGRQDAASRLQQSTDQLIRELSLSNRNMREIRDREAIRVDGDPALSAYLSNDLPTGGRETDRLVTVEHPDGLLFLVFIAPERDFQRYERAFDEMLRSVRIKR